MKGILTGSALAALAMFFWGFLWWGAPHYIPYKTAMKTAPKEAARTCRSARPPAPRPRSSS